MRGSRSATAAPLGAASGRAQQLHVVGMGKLGGAELNVSSDIDLVFAYPGGRRHAGAAADQQPRVLHARSAAG